MSVSYVCKSEDIWIILTYVVGDIFLWVTADILRKKKKKKPWLTTKQKCPQKYM